MVKAKPYVGITGTVNSKEVVDTMSEFISAGYDMHTTHIPMMGFLVSQKTLSGKPFDNRRYPNINLIPELCQKPDNTALTMIHYNTQDKSTLSDQVKQIFRTMYEDNLCRAIQLNMVWPEVKQVAEIKKFYPDMKIVFQANASAMKNKSPAMFATKVQQYGDSIDYALIDPSGGWGKEFNIDDSVNIFEELEDKLPHLTIGFAGGLKGNNVQPIIWELESNLGFNEFCIDAEGALRNKITDKYGDDIYDQEKAKDYIHESAEVLRPRNHSL